LALSRASLDAARAVAEARAFDSLLKSSAFAATAVEPWRLENLHARIMTAARPRQGGWFALWFGFELTPRQLWPSAAGLAAATVLGFGLGFGGILQSGIDHDSEDVSVLSALENPVSAP
jgi:hypothetical protein